MEKDLISIIIPVFNRAQVVKKTIESIIEQTYENWECLLIDDGSNEINSNALNNYTKLDERILYIKRPESKQKGGNSCRNFGFEISKGEYIQWFDSDDIMHPNKLEIKFENLNNSTFDYVVCAGVEFKDSIKNTFNKWNKIYSEQPLLDHITGKISFHTNGPMFKRTLLDGTGLFDESLIRKQEWEYYTRILSKSINYKPINEILYYFRIHNNSINGENHKSTLNSRISANQKVFLQLKKHSNLLEIKPYLRKHFFNKFIYNIQLAIKHRQIENIYLAIQGLSKTFNLSLFLREVLTIFKNPKVVLNLFKVKNLK